MNKRGLSTVVTTIILVLLGLVAVGVVWSVIQNVLTSTEDDISIRGSKVNLKIKDVQFSDGNIQVRVERGIGEGEIIGLKFTISDGSNTEVRDEPNVNLDELETKTYSLTYSGIVKEIIVSPVIKSSSGKTGLGTLYGIKEFTNEEIIENLGAVSWWRFEDNVRDKLGNNHGTNNGADCSVNGKYGGACEFDGSDDYVDVGSTESLNMDKNITIAAWIRFNNVSNNGWIVERSGGNYWLWWSANDDWGVGTNNFIFGGGFVSIQIEPSFIASNNNWYHVVATSLDNIGRVYVNGTEIGTGLVNINMVANSVNNVDIGFRRDGNPPSEYHYFNGTIDEVMIFDRALTAAEIEDLYNYKF